MLDRMDWGTYMFKQALFMFDASELLLEPLMNHYSMRMGICLLHL